MKSFVRKFLFFGLVVAFAACDNGNGAPEIPAGGESSSVCYVLNSGDWQSANSSLTKYDLATGVVVQNYFEQQNNRCLGATANDMLVHGSKMYIAVSGESTIEITSLDAKSIKQIECAGQPRYLAAHGDKVYVTYYVTVAGKDFGGGIFEETPGTRFIFKDIGGTGRRSECCHGKKLECERLIMFRLNSKQNARRKFFRQARCYFLFLFVFKELAEIGGVEFLNRLFQFFTGAEFDHGTFRNDDFVAGIAGVAALAALADFDFKNTEVTQFNITPLNKFLGDVIQGHLDDIGNITLNDSGFFCDFDNKVTLSHFLFSLHFFMRSILKQA